MSINERLAVVETQIEHMVEAGDRREEKQDEILAELKAAREAAELVQRELNRYKGFLGGATFILSCVGVFLYRFGAPLYKLVQSAKTGG